MNSKRKFNKIKIGIAKIFYIISLLCWIIYFLSGIYAMIFGVTVGFYTPKLVYGYEAFQTEMLLNLLKFTFIPVLPITLMYMLIYTIVKIIQVIENNKILE